VLDLEWTLHDGVLGAVLCVATSTGSLLFYSLSPTAGTLTFVSSKQIADARILVLDLLWHPKRLDVIAVTLSDGSVCICRSESLTEFWAEVSKVETRVVTAHELEPWTLAFSPGCEVLWSGGDDALLQRIPLDLPDPGSAAQVEQDMLTAVGGWSDRKIHQAGVTAILPLTNELLVTGSYDDHIRLISAPAVGRRRVMTELDLGGGVWRLKLMDRDVMTEPGRLFDRYVAQEVSPDPEIAAFWLRGRLTCI